MSHEATRIRIIRTDGIPGQSILTDDRGWAEQHADWLRTRDGVKDVAIDTVPTVIVDVPHTFYDDHQDRDLPSGYLVKRLARTYRIALDREAYDDLLSDADHYADPGMAAQLGREYVGLVASARATIRALRRADRPAAPAPTWRNDVGVHTMILEDGDAVMNPTRTGHWLHGPRAFIYRVWEDGGLDITEVDRDDPRLRAPT